MQWTFPQRTTKIYSLSASLQFLLAVATFIVEWHAGHSAQLRPPKYCHSKPHFLQVHLSHLPTGVLGQLSCSGFRARRAALGFPLDPKQGKQLPIGSSQLKILCVIIILRCYLERLRRHRMTQAHPHVHIENWFTIQMILSGVDTTLHEGQWLNLINETVTIAAEEGK